MDFYAALQANRALEGIGETTRPRREPANTFPEALREGRADCPLYAPFLTRMLADPFQYPIRKRAAEASRNWPRRNSAKASFLVAGRLRLHCLHYVIADKDAGCWGNLAGAGAMLAILSAPFGSIGHPKYGDGVAI